MNNPFIVRYHSSWIETDETHSFSAIGSPHSGETGSTFDTGTDPSAPLTESTEESTEDGSDVDSNSNSDSDDSDSVVEFDEDSTPGAELDFEFGDDLDDMDFLSVGHDRSRSASYPQIHFGNDDSDSDGSTTDDASKSRRSPVLSRKGQSKKGTKPSSPVDSPRNKQVRTLYIQVRRSPPSFAPKVADLLPLLPDGICREAHPSRGDR